MKKEDKHFSFKIDKKEKITRRKSENNLFFRLKNKSLSKKDEVLLGALIIGTSGLLGYYGFLNGPIQNREAILKALQDSNTHVVQAKSGEAEDIISDSEYYMEDEVAEAVSTYVSSDPNVMISSEEFLNENDKEGSLNLTIEHTGTPGELSQYLDTLASSEKPIMVDNLSYQKDLIGTESTIISLKIPYAIVDGSLETQSFMGTNLELSTSPAPSTAPPTTATPVSKVTSSTSGSSLPSKSLPKLKSPSTLSKPNTSTTNNSNTSGNQGTSNGNAVKPVEKKSPVKETSPVPERKADKVYNAKPIVNYSIIDSLNGFESMDGLVLEISSLDRVNNPSTPILDQWLKIAFNTPHRPGAESQTSPADNSNQGKNGQEAGSDQEGANPSAQDQGSEAKEAEGPKDMAVEREIRLNTGGIYLPKNAYELSFDIVLPLKTQGDFQLVLSNEEGEILVVEESRRVELGTGFSRIFFPLKNMDGTIRANQFRYKFLDKAEVRDELMLKNFQILSHE